MESRAPLIGAGCVERDDGGRGETAGCCTAVYSCVWCGKVRQLWRTRVCLAGVAFIVLSLAVVFYFSRGMGWGGRGMDWGGKKEEEDKLSPDIAPAVSLALTAVLVPLMGSGE